jgi:transposase-like protein
MISCPICKEEMERKNAIMGGFHYYYCTPCDFRTMYYNSNEKQDAIYDMMFMRRRILKMIKGIKK